MITPPDGVPHPPRPDSWRKGASREPLMRGGLYRWGQVLREASGSVLGYQVRPEGVKGMSEVFFVLLKS